MLHVSLEWGSRVVRSTVTTLRLDPGRALVVGEADDCAIALPGVARHTLVEWDGAHPIVHAPPGGRLRVGSAIVGKGPHWMVAGEELEVRSGAFVVRLARVTDTMATGVRAAKRLDVRPILWSVLGHAVALALLGMAVREPAPAQAAHATLRPNILAIDPGEPSTSPAASPAPATATAPSTFAHVPVRAVDTIERLAVSPRSALRRSL